MQPTADIGGCRPGASSQIGDSERFESADMRTWDWRVGTPGAVQPERLLGTGAGLRVLDASVASRFWLEYTTIRRETFQSPAPCDYVNARILVRFQTNVATRWVAVGKECALMMTEDHVCHPLDVAAFRDFVRVAGVADQIERSDRTMATYLGDAGGR